MTVVEINKYRPSFFENGRFLREDWTSCSQIGKTFNGRVMSIDDYLVIEQRYLTAIRHFMDAAALHELAAYNVEHWNVGRPDLKTNGLDDVLDRESTHTEGELLSRPRLQTAFTQCLREVGWLEFVKKPVFLIHFGYDLRVIVSTDADPGPAITKTRELGLFVYEGNTRLPTLDAWRGL